MATIHPSAVVDPRAELADDVVVEALCVIGAGVTIGAGTVVYPNSVINGPIVIGAGCKLGPAAYVGGDPQHLDFIRRPDKPLTWAELGDGVIVREAASIHRSSKPGRENATRVGDRCMIMSTAHVAHDCRLAEDVTMANGALLGGHVTVGPRSFIGGGAVVHQFCRVGRLAMVGGNQPVGHDIPPFSAMLNGGLKGYNAVGCKRSGMSRDAIHAIRAAYQCFHTIRTLSGVIVAIRQITPAMPEVQEIAEFMSAAKRGIQPSVRFLNYLRAGDEE